MMEELRHSFGIDDCNDVLSTSTAQHEPRSPVSSGLQFTLSFVVTYHYCLLAVTVLASITHWSRILLRARRSSKEQNRLGHLQCKSSTETGNDGSSGIDETTALLRHGEQTRRPTLYTLWARRRRAVLMLHPAWLKELPGNDVSACIALMLGLNLFYTFYGITLTRPLLFVFADRAGMLFVANLPWLYLLSAKNQPLRLLTGSSYEGLNIYHRALGSWLAVLAILHTGGMTIVWYDFLRPRGLDIWWFLGRTIIWVGLGAFTSYEVLTLTSLASFRRWWYEMFLGCHTLLQATGLGFLFFHYHRCRIYVIIALAIFLLDRLMHRLTMKTRTFTADLTILEDGQTVMISSNWLLKVKKRAARLLSRDLHHGWATTDHVFLTVPSLGHKHRLQAHPFTIASAAPKHDDTHAWFNLIIRVRDGFTRDLLEYARQHSTAAVRLDGPYGSTHAVDMLLDSELAIVVAGGSGIAVAFPLVWRLLHKQCRSSARLHRPQRVCLIWIINDARHISWIGHERLNELQQLGLTVVIPPPTSKAGRPDIPQLLKDSIHELSGDDSNCKTRVVASGPLMMNRTIRNTCAQLAWQGNDINVAVEVFDW